VRAALEVAHANITAYHEAQRHPDGEHRNGRITVRELQRLESELDRARAVGSAPPGHTDVTPFLAAARDAIEELVSASTTSVERLSTSLVHVTEISELVRVLGNRSTLIALQAAIAGAEASPDVHADMRRLAGEVQDTTARAAELCRAVEREAAGALTRMREVRGGVAARLDAIPELPVGADSGDETSRLIERMREMIQDAARKSERLSAAGERVSRAAERLVRGLEEEASELAGLTARLTRPEAAAIVAARPGDPARALLRLLDTDVETDDLERPETSEPPQAREEHP